MSVLCGDTKRVILARPQQVKEGSGRAGETPLRKSGCGDRGKR